jgi:hypothetical protein
MHPFTIIYTERWAKDDLRNALRERHAQAGEPDWSPRLAHVRSEIAGCLGILRESKRNKAWWDKPKRTAREKAICEAAVGDIGKYFQLTAIKLRGGFALQMWDDMAFRAWKEQKPEAIKAMEILDAITVYEPDQSESAEIRISDKR